MSDVITAKGNDSKFAPHREGQFVGLCVDVIDLGEKVESGPDWPEKLTPKCAMVFRTGQVNADTGDYIDIAREFTVSMGDKANLRKFLEQWRGKPYTPVQVEEGVPLHKLTGNWALLTISHKASGKGRTYANVTACVGVPPQMNTGLPVFEDYTRAEYWSDRKKEYAEGAARFRAVHAAPQTDAPDSGMADDSDDLPF